MKNALRFIFLILTPFVFLQNVQAQNGSANQFRKDFDKVDSLATGKKNEAALALINDIGIRARKAGNTQVIIKSVTLRMLFQSYLKGNDLTKHIASLREDVAQAKQPEKSILQSILGEAYWTYYTQNNYRISQRTDVQGDTVGNITLWSGSRLQREVANTYLASVSETATLQAVSVKNIPDILVGDTATSYLRPTLYDVLVHRALTVLTNYQINQQPNNTLSLSVENSYNTLLKYHLDHGNKAASADLELLWIKRQHKSDEDQAEYLDKLTQLLSKAEGTEIYTEVLIEMASVYLVPGRGISEKTRLTTAIAFLEKGIKAFPNSNGAKRAQKLVNDTKVKSLRIELKSNNMPNAPIRAQYFYTNVDSIYVKIYKVSALNEKGYYDNKGQYMAFLNANTPVKSYAIRLHEEIDYRYHTTEDYFEELPLGNYVLIAQNHQIADTLNKELVNSVTKFTVSNLAVSNRATINGDLYKVLDSRTGLPLQGVKITNVYYNNKTELPTPNSTVVTDQNGNANSPFNQKSGYTIVNMGKDTALLNFSYNYPRDRPGRLNVIFFKDRPIYRPGQKVFFKGLVVKRSDLGNKIMPGEKIEVTFKDVKLVVLMS